MADGWADLPSLILIGEIHGSREIPKVVLALATSTISRGLSVSIGLEMETSEQHALDAYMASSGTDADVTKLLSGAHWRLEDGRASEAILEIIEFARRQRERTAAAARPGALRRADGGRAPHHLEGCSAAAALTSERA